MPLSLAHLRTHQKVKTTRRVGRGTGSGRGTYSGRGIKGQKARTGGKSGLKRRGLKQYLLQIPKVRGFKREKMFRVVNIGLLSSKFSEKDHITPMLLKKHGMLHHGVQVKILGSGKITKKLSISAHAFSASAKKAIEAAGGTAHVITE